MKKITVIVSIITFMLVMVIGCGQKNASSAIEKKITDLGYEIIAKEEDVETIEIKSKAEEYKEVSRAKFWDVQNLDIEKFEGKTITYHIYRVKNHPVEKNTEGAQATEIAIGTIDNEIVAGYSLPYLEGEIFLGGVSSLTGETLEQVTGLSYEEWVTQWENEYN